LEFVGETKKWLQTLDELSESTQNNGHVAVQVRIKSVHRAQYQELAKQALQLLGPDTRTILNGTLEDAQRLGYWGAHIQTTVLKNGLSKFDLEFVSVPAHNQVELHSADRSQVSAVLCSPVFKPIWKNVDPLGPCGLRRMSQSSGVPLYALGGVTPDRCETCLDAGAVGIAVLSGVLGAKNPSEAVAKYLRHRVSR
jgi:thiamine-phosphate pyrophosphorylase